MAGPEEELLQEEQRQEPQQQQQQQQQSLYQWQWRRPDSFAHGRELARMLFYVAPVMWGVRLYDLHWASKASRQAEVHEIARRVQGDWTKSDGPIPLPRVRKRTLTGPLPPIESMSSLAQSIRRSRQHTESQAGSAFLNIVPYEVRQDIYELVLLGEDRTPIHIFRKHGRLGHWRCRIVREGPEICDATGGRCLEGWLLYKAKLWHLDKAGMIDIVTDGGNVALLMTCRAIYTEAVNIIYARNTFHFYDPGDIRYFGRNIVPQRLNAINSLIIDWERTFSIFNKENGVPKMDNDEWRAWSDTWDIIAKMENLRYLRILLKSHQHMVPTARRQKMCEPLMAVRGLRKFELVIPWDDDTDWDFAADAPFSIIRGPRPQPVSDLMM